MSEAKNLLYGLAFWYYFSQKLGIFFVVDVYWDIFLNTYQKGKSLYMHKTQFKSEQMINSNYGSFHVKIHTYLVEGLLKVFERHIMKKKVTER